MNPLTSAPRSIALTVGLGLLLPLAIGLLAAPTAAADCQWDAGFRAQVESGTPVRLHDGDVCTASVECPMNPVFVCEP